MPHLLYFSLPCDKAWLGSKEEQYVTLLLGADFTCPHGDARVDFCDLFAFPKPDDSSRSILIIDVHPSVSVNPEGPTSAESFAPEAIYELKIDTDGDAVADIAYRVRFSPSENGTQSAMVRRPAPPGLEKEGKPSSRVLRCRPAPKRR
ncbi:MAG TPA: DUF4331 family protein [Rubrobacter sp.]|nr:DUF4331 family protein [Rubrobacter sp.]